MAPIHGFREPIWEGGSGELEKSIVETPSDPWHFAKKTVLGKWPPKGPSERASAFVPL